MASLGVVAMMALPVVRMFFSRGSSAFTKAVAVFYSVFLCLLVVRAWCGLVDPSLGMMQTNALQSITFLVQLLQLIIALPAYTLIIKEYADEALLLMATTDRLTGATNRHAFLDAAMAIHRNSRIFKTPLAVLFLDIDFFKKVNDKYGHAFGDRVLTNLAAIIDSCLRDSDLSCRYGGEEFVVLLSRSDMQAAQIVSCRIMEEVRALRFPEQPDFSFTVSIGVFCGVPRQDQTFDEVVRYADEAMYQAKNAGRNRVIFSEMCDETRRIAISVIK
jgi:diguanylate cyclase (GGDEF)-like protein